jgi:hypothetical protein
MKRDSNTLRADNSYGMVCAGHNRRVVAIGVEESQKVVDVSVISQGLYESFEWKFCQELLDR